MHRLAPAQASALLVKPATDAQPVPSGGRYFTGEYSVEYRPGEVALTGSADGSEPINVDDVAELTVTRPDASQASLVHDFSNGCGPLVPVAALDLTGLLQVGSNRLTVVLRDQCGGSVGNTDVYIVADDADLAAVGIPMTLDRHK
jgi:hypothetical protein